MKFWNVECVSFLKPSNKWNKGGKTYDAGIKETSRNERAPAEEKMTPLEAFRSFTLDAAYAGHQEQIIGSLATGKKADFILLDNNLFTMAKENIWRTSVNKTWVNGKLVFEK